MTMRPVYADATLERDAVLRDAARLRAGERDERAWADA